MRRVTALAFVLAVTVGWVRPAGAQSLGVFSWQVQPYCNRITGVVTQVAGVYTFDAYDDVCGAAQRVPVTGTLTPNPDGTIEVGLAQIGASGVALHTTARISLPGASGTWRDSQGLVGAFVLAGNTGGSGRPSPSAAVADGSITGAKLAADAVDASKIAPGAVGAADIDTTEVQRRVSGACPALQLMTGVNADGSVTCAAAPSGGGGDITAVVAGAGLSGGATTGSATLAVVFDGDGVQSAVARADHAHAIPGNQLSTRVGGGALAVSTGPSNTALGFNTLHLNTTGRDNTAVGDSAMAGNLAGESNVAVGRNALGIATASNNVGVGNATLFAASGCCNTAVGSRALEGVTTAITNVAVGTEALLSTTAGGGNVAVGAYALRLATGDGNSALGAYTLTSLATGLFNAGLGGGALNDLTSGSNNLAVGYNAGDVLTNGSGNIYVGAPSAAASESNTTRIGTTQTAAFLAGVSGQTSASGVPVMINTAGKLGTTTSSARFKDDITALGDDWSARLQALRPVRFVYKSGYDDGTRTPQFGLIAEEVAESIPELVVRDDQGQVQTVRYHFLPPLLLAEVQRLERERASLTATVTAQAAAIAELRAAIATLVARER